MMYTKEQRDHFKEEQKRVAARLLDLNFQGLLQSQKIDDEESKKYMTQGVGRRLDVLKRCLERVFELFPLDQERALGRVVLTDVQIYLHAFVMNQSSVFSIIGRGHSFIGTGDERIVDVDVGHAKARPSSLPHQRGKDDQLVIADSRAESSDGLNRPLQVRHFLAELLDLLLVFLQDGQRLLGKPAQRRAGLLVGGVLGVVLE